MDIADLIRSIPDYPKPGVIFRDITTLLQHPAGFRHVVDELVQPFAGAGISHVAGIEARGFILGGAVAHQLSVGFVAIHIVFFDLFNLWINNWYHNCLGNFLARVNIFRYCPNVVKIHEDFSVVPTINNACANDKVSL